MNKKHDSKTTKITTTMMIMMQQKFLNAVTKKNIYFIITFDLMSYYGNQSVNYLVFSQRYYTPTARELARLAGIQQAPILHHFGESLAGAATIRAFDQEDRFYCANLDLIDNHSRPWFHNVSAMEWLSFRLNCLSNFVFAFSLVVLVSLPEGIISPSEYSVWFETLLLDR